MSAKQKRLAELRASIPEVSATEAFQEQQQGAVLLDVREIDEISQGSPAHTEKGRTHRVGRGFLELKIEEIAPDLDTPLLALCAGGTRSLFAADDLVKMGYSRVRSVAGGFSGWKKAGLPIEVPRTLGQEDRERYSRHLSIPEVGEEGQARLLDSRVLLVGAGGLGCPTAYYLAAAGVGTLGIVDDDIVDRSNLQRQILHTDDRVGMPKVESAQKTLSALNPGIRVVPHPERLTSENVEKIFSGYDLVVDGTDNFATRYLINDACVKLGLPNVHGSVFRFEGQVSVFWPGRLEDPGPCYRCLYPEPPPPDLAPSCAEAGVLGVLPGVVGLLQAVETIKVLLDIGQPLVGRLLRYEALETRFSVLKLRRDEACSYCSGEATAHELTDVAFVCNTAAASA